MSNIKHLLLNDNSIVLQLTAGPTTITPSSFNYNKIKRLLPTTEANILPLLKSPDLTDGLHFLYLLEVLYLKHIKPDYTVEYARLKNNLWIPTNKPDIDNLPILGLYTNIDNIREDFPEYFI